MELLIKAAQLLLCLSLLVVLHELGHFIPARLFGTRVEKFYLFFDPWFSLWKHKRGDTEYGIGWLPLGGYVKISGMVDESMDKAQMALPPQPWEFRSKPAWQRLIIMLGGVTVNLLLGMLIYIGVLFTWGREYLPLENLQYGIYPSPLMAEQGLRGGDRIIGVEGRKPQTLEEVYQAILVEEARTLTVLRDGHEHTVALSSNVQDLILDRNDQDLLMPAVPFVLDSVLPGGGAAVAGFRKGDRIVAVNGAPAAFFQDFRAGMDTLKGQRVQLGVERAGAYLTLPVEVSAEGMIGVSNLPLDRYLSFATERFGFLTSIPEGVRYGLRTLTGYVRSLKLLFSSSGVKQVGGFGSIGNLFAPRWDWHRFWDMTAFISIMLAFMNVLPIPALDGGHVLFLLYEMIARRPASQKVMEYAQTVGMVLLMGLVLFANGNDVFKWLTGRF
jgi:regulator of sigma E protease